MQSCVRKVSAQTLRGFHQPASTRTSRHWRRLARWIRTSCCLLQGGNWNKRLAPADGVALTNLLSGHSSRLWQDISRHISRRPSTTVFAATRLTLAARSPSATLASCATYRSEQPTVITKRVELK